MGAFEFGGSFTDVKLVKQESQGKRIRFFQAQNGVLFVTVNDTTQCRDYALALYDAAGRQLGQHSFNGATTAIRLPMGAKGMVVVRVDGSNGFVGTAKAVVR